MLIGRFVRWGLERNPPFGPGSDLLERILERATLLGELVLDADRSIGDDPARHQILRLKGPQSLGQHSISDVGDRGFNERVPRFPLQQGLNDGASPTTTDELDSAVETSANPGGDFGHEER